MGATATSRMGRANSATRSASKERRLKSHQSSRISRDGKPLVSQEKLAKVSRGGSRSKNRPKATTQTKAPLFKQSHTQKQMQLNPVDDLLRAENSYVS